MGIRIDEPIIGDACFCHPEPVSTPARIYVLFNGLTPCPGKPVPPNGTTFVCAQDSFDPCLFFSGPDSNGFVANVQFFCALGDVTVGLFIPAGDSSFFSLLNTPISEYEAFSNDQIACAPGRSAFGGVASIFWLDTVFEQVLDFNLPTDGDGLFLETFQVSSTKFVNRYANKTYELNKKLLFSP